MLLSHTLTVMCVVFDVHTDQINFVTVSKTLFQDLLPFIFPTVNASWFHSLTQDGQAESVKPTCGLTKAGSSSTQLMI